MSEDGITILQHDLTILEQMVKEMQAYLNSGIAYWTLEKPDMPRLTIGGTLMRQHRLVILRDRLTPTDQGRLDTTLQRFDASVADRVVRFENRAHQELHARLNEWINHMKRENFRDLDHYADIADCRVVISTMMQRLVQPPYRLEAGIADEVVILDRKLNGRWQPGDFIWHEVWQPVYPSDDYWWLYGHPR